MNTETTPDGSLSLEYLIDERCDAFESAWRSGQRPDINEFVRSADSSLQSKLFCELLLVELEVRRSLGEQPRRDEYLKRFPQFAAQIIATNLRYGPTAFVEPSGGKIRKSSNTTFAPGTHVGRFQLLERLGGGAMGEAWKAVDTLIGRAVTIKLPRGHLVNETDWCRFKREAEIAAQMCHPAIASVLTLEREENRFYLVGDYIEGTNLREYSSRIQLPFEGVAELCAALCDAVQYAHGKDVVHRDLKPANIIIDPEGRPHVIDFGLAKIASSNNDLTIEGELLGTIAYMSPELANGNGGRADFKTDIYSLGVILYELLTGNCPFKGDRNSVIAQILSCKPLRPRVVRPRIPADLETICLKAIEQAPSDRYASAGEMAKDLRRYIARMPIQARPVGILERGSRWIRRHPAIAVSFILLLCVAVAISAVISMLYKQNQQLAGYRPVQITTTPSGARIAIVPLDPSTNEPYPDLTGIVKPSGTTPLSVQLKPGNYLVEAALPGTTAGFVDVYRTVAEPTRNSANMAQANIELGVDPQTCRFSDIKIARRAEDLQNMVVLDIPDDIRNRNPLVPTQLYFDARQTTPAELKSNAAFVGIVNRSSGGAAYITYTNAASWAERNQKRLPSAAEYDAIVATLKRHRSEEVLTGKPIVDGLSDDLAEWTTTMKDFSKVAGKAAAKHLRQMHVLKGFENVETSDLLVWIDGTLLAERKSENPKICIRGVRSATPRFLTP